MRLASSLRMLGMREVCVLLHFYAFSFQQLKAIVPDVSVTVRLRFAIGAGRPKLNVFSLYASPK